MTSARPVTWDPAQYAVFEDHRSRPFADLGCGSGALTLGLAQRWPAARVVGVDSSPHMLEQARAGDREGRVEWVEADVADWQPPTGIDLLVTNATLQWVPGHLELIPRWVVRSEEHTSELQSRQYLVCRLLLEKKKKTQTARIHKHKEKPRQQKA